MIYKNGEEFKNYLEDNLGKNFRLPKAVKFYLSSMYEGTSVVNDRNVKTYPSSFALETKYSTSDKDGNTVEIRYAQRTSQKGSNNGFMKQFLPEFVVFSKGVLVVNKEQIDLYWFLINHPRCETNKKYLKEKEGKIVGVNDDAMASAGQIYGHMLFRERNEGIEQELHYDTQAKVIEAMSHITTKMTQQEVIDTYKAYEGDYDETMPLKKLKNYLLGKAQQDPKQFMDLLDSEVRTFKTRINEAVAAEVLFFHKLNSRWRWSGEGNNKDNVILVVAKGVEPVSALAMHLKTKDDGELYKEIEERLAAKQAEFAQ